jgi:hypothetical protein
MGSIIITFIVVEVFSLIGYYLGRFLAPFLINQFTIRLINFTKLSSDTSESLESPLLRITQNFASAGSGIFAALGVRVASTLPNLQVSIGFWLFTSLIVAWFSAASGVSGRFRCSIISFIFYWLVFFLL